MPIFICIMLNNYFVCNEKLSRTSARRCSIERKQDQRAIIRASRCLDQLSRHYVVLLFRTLPRQVSKSERDSLRATRDCNRD